MDWFAYWLDNGLIERVSDCVFDSLITLLMTDWAGMVDWLIA